MTAEESDEKDKRIDVLQQLLAEVLVYFEGMAPIYFDDEIALRERIRKELNFRPVHKINNPGG